MVPRGDDGRGVAAKSPGELLTERGPRNLLMRQRDRGHALPPAAESIGRRSQRGELKHLSTPRKRKRASTA